MRTLPRILTFTVVAAITLGVLAAQPQRGRAPAAGDTPPPWAYPVRDPDVPRAPRAQDDGTPQRVPGSPVAFTLSETRDLFNPPDWHPEGHPPMPEIVAHGRSPEVRACGYCHLTNGQGRPENASLAGMPAAYIVQQMADYKNGLRKSSEPRMGPPNAMLAIGEAANDAEVLAAAEYFASFDFKQWIRVVESATVPKPYVSGAMFVASEDGSEEPIGQRIVELPEDLGRTGLRDGASGFVAYVPPGSIRRGEELVQAAQCGICHGSDLKGLGPVPGLAGRSPSYAVRQLYDFQTGARHGVWSELMQEVVADLTLEDLVAIGAYTASLAP